MFTHGTLNRPLEMKTPPPLNQGSDSMRGDAANQALGVTRANYSSAVSSLCLQCDWYILALSEQVLFFSSHTSARGHSGVTQCVYQFTTITTDISCLFIFPCFLPQRGVLYQGLHSGSSMVAMGKAGLLGHGLGGYGLPSPGASGASAWLFCFCPIRIQI